MRSVVPLILIGAFGLNVSSYARDVSLGKPRPRRSKASARKSAGGSRKTLRDTTARPIATEVLEPTASSAARLACHASPK